MSSANPEPEIYWTKPNTHCPNSRFPVLVYRNVLPDEHTEDAVRAVIERNDWKHGGTFKHYPAAHFHSNTHELYAALSGSTSCQYGVGPLDDQSQSVRFDMKAGDVAVHAAGVSHRNVESSEDYAYMGFYPKGSPRWNNNFCKAGEEETHQRAEEARQIPIPSSDPIYGVHGPLPRIWAAV